MITFLLTFLLAIMMVGVPILLCIALIGFIGIAILLSMALGYLIARVRGKPA